MTVQGFGFLTAEVIDMEKKARFSQCMNGCNWWVACSGQSERAPTSAPGRVDDVCIENNVFVLFLLDT